MVNWQVKSNGYTKKLKAPGSVLLALVIVFTALTDVGQANVVGSDTQNFNPTTSGLDFVTVQSSETLAPGFFNFGLFFNHAVNTLPYFRVTEDRQNRIQVNDSITGMDLNFGVGLLPGWDVGLSLPHVIYQKVESGGFHGQFGENGNTEIRINTKVRLYGDQDGGVALIGSANIDRIKDNPFTGRNSGPTYNIEAAFDTTVKRIALGFNIGYRFRDSGEKLPSSLEGEEELPVEPLENQVIASAAASYLFSSIDTKLIFELFGSRNAKTSTENSDRLSSSAEGLVGLKYDITRSFAGHVGAGTELLHGQSSPDWRAYAGVNWSVGPTFSKPKHAIKAKKSPPKAYGKKDPFSGPIKAREKIIIHDILFEFDSDHLVLKGADTTLGKLVKYMHRKKKYKKLIIEGHTDSVGSHEYNADLSKRRANTIKMWLVKRYKLDPNTIVTIGRGERFPIADNGNYQGRQLNRRVEFVIIRE